MITSTYQINIFFSKKGRLNAKLWRLYHTKPEKLYFTLAFSKFDFYDLKNEAT